MAGRGLQQIGALGIDHLLPEQREYGAGLDGRAPAHHGLIGYEGFPASFEEYLERVNDRHGDHQKFLDLQQAVWARDNVFAAGARPFAGEADPLVVGEASVSVEEVGDEVYLVTSFPSEVSGKRLTVGHLPRVRFADADFEEPDGTPVVLDKDLIGADKPGSAPAGPLAAPGARVKVWG